MPHTLLLADDSVTIRRVIELTFADEDVSVVSVSSGREAMAAIEGSRPDIVLADAGMPDVSGYDIAAFVKGRADLKHIPVILLAGAFEPLDEARARQSGSSGVLVKPFEPQMAVARVRELLSTTEQRTPAAAAPAAPAAPAPPALASPKPPTLERAPLPQTDAPSMSSTMTPIDSAFDASLDRLDEAFATSAGNSPPALDPTAATDFANDLRELRSGRIDSGGFERQDFGDWDLPARPASGAGAPAPPIQDDLPPPPIVPLPPPITLAPKAVPPPAPAPAPAVPAPAHRPAPLADVFSNLLAAEEGRPHAPFDGSFGTGPQPGGPLTSADMDRIVDRLIERLGPDVRVAVIDLAERLVRAEIDRLKALR